MSWGQKTANAKVLEQDPARHLGGTPGSECAWGRRAGGGGREAGEEMLHGALPHGKDFHLHLVCNEQKQDLEQRSDI
jgi:hypothetical protein